MDAAYSANDPMEAAYLVPPGDAVLYNRTLAKELASAGQAEKEASPEVRAYTWAARGFNGSVYCYLVDSWVRHFAQDALVLRDGVSFSFEYSPGQSKSIPVHNHLRVFSWNSKLYSLSMENFSVTITGNNDVTEIRLLLDAYIKENNPYRGKLLEVRYENGELHCNMKVRQEVPFDNVILPEQLKIDIFDNTVYNMRALDGNNGVILYGPPGTGKSHLCKAISWELAQDNIASIILSSAVDFSKLQSLLAFIGPCVVFLEDADTYAFTRDITVGNGILADFLQFVNGISEVSERVLFIVTTNYLEKLDEAVSNRPMRFNRKFKIDIPTNEEVEQLVQLYFGHEGFCPSKCYNKQFTGSHIQELRRTATLLASKTGSSLEEVFDEAVGLVAKHFSPTLSETGFRVS